MDRRIIIGFGIALLAIIVVLGSCSVLLRSRPKVVIDSPQSNSQFFNGQVVSVQSTSTDSAGINRVELSVDGVVVHTDNAPGPVVSFTVTQTWQATPGEHTLSVRAYNISNTSSDPALVAISILPTSAPAAAPSLTPSATVLPPTSPSAVCTDDAGFVADVTIPDGTVLSAGQSFAKTWRVRNTGTCTWDSGYLFTFVGGEAMTNVTTYGVPPTPPGATADLTLPLSAPTSPGAHTGLWRLESPSGAGFGLTLSVSIRVAGAPTAATCSGTPNIASFSASPTTITAGQSAALSWGFVSNAQIAEIDQGIGGVGTPGSTKVSPRTTTTYTLTATCGSNRQTAQVTITVLPAPTATITPVPTATPLPPTATPLPPTTTPTPRPVARVVSNLTGNVVSKVFTPTDSFAKGDTVWVQVHIADQNGTNLDGAKVLFTVFNPANNPQCALVSATTDAAGIALASCKIPSNAATGTWNVHIDDVIKSGFSYDASGSQTDHTFTVS